MVEIARRSLLGGIATGLAAAAAPAFSAGRAATALNLADRSDRLKAYMLMRGALDDRLVVGCFSGNYFGVVDDQITPLWDVVSATFSRYRRRADGGYDGFTAEIAHFIDPVTRRATGRLYNPYTGETVDEPHQGFPPSKIVIGPGLDLHPARPIPGVTMDVKIAPRDEGGDDIWFRELSQNAMTFPGAAKPVRYSENVVLHARRSDLERPGAMRVRTDVAFTNFVSWRPWMKMGDRPGHMTAVGTGVNSDSLDVLPRDWIEATRARRPEVLDNPGKLIDAIWKAG